MYQTVVIWGQKLPKDQVAIQDTKLISIMNVLLHKPSMTWVTHRKRYQQILSVFTRHGFGSIVGKLQKSQPIFQINHQQKLNLVPGLTPAVHFRLALEELGPTFIKIGQILTTRPDLLGPEFIQELSKLQDEVPPVQWEDIRPLLTDELGDEPEDIFASIDPVPLAAASISQVHSAILRNGDAVVVKVQRPNIQTTIETDVAILMDLAAMAQHTEWGERNQPEEVIEEFAFSLRNELDYCREGRNADRFQTNFSGDKRLYVPTVYWEYSSRRVLVMERIEGIKINDIPALDAAGNDRRQIAQDAASCIVKEVLQYGFYHADPHGGNLIVMQDGVIGIMDFGMMGELRDTERHSLARLYISITSLDADGIVDELMRMSVARSGVNRTRLVSDLRRLLQKYSGLTLKQIRFQEIVQDSTNIMQRHDLILPPYLWMLGKALAMMEGLGLELDPDFDFFSVSEPIVQRLKRHMFLPNGEWGKALIRQGADWSEFMILLPRASRRLLEKIEQGQPFNVELSTADNLICRLGRLVNRLSFSVIIAALVISLAILIATTSDGSPIQSLVAVGFLGVVILGIGLIISIIRGR